jgi:hypothetical protein
MEALVIRSCGKRAEPDIGSVGQLTHSEKLPALPLTSREFVKAFTSDKK